MEPAISTPASRPPGDGFALLGLAALLLLLQLPLVVNPGYLSFDELQWWARADVPAFADLPWVSWADWRVFQYRPLTFNLWLVLAHAFAAHACAMHAAFVLLGTLNALLLAACLRALGTRRAAAASAAAAFVLSPYAAYTHGWTGTLADLLVLMFGLLGARALAAPDAAAARARSIAFALALLALFALLAKESAVVLPALWLIIGLLRCGPRHALTRVAPAALVVAAYLAVRVPTLWFIGAGNEAYAWGLANAPARACEYALFPWLPPLFEIGPSLGKSALRLGIAAACGGAVLFALLRAHWRYAAVWLLLCMVALAPVLVLARSFDQYAYLASAAGIGVVACAWSQCDRIARGLLLATGAVASVHGAQIMLRMREVGAIEQRFHGDLVAVLRDSAQSLRIVPARAADGWMLERWVGNVPSYRRVTLTGRVALGPGTPDTVALTMRPDGALAPVPFVAR